VAGDLEARQDLPVRELQRFATDHCGPGPHRGRAGQLPHERLGQALGEDVLTDHRDPGHIVVSDLVVHLVDGAVRYPPDDGVVGPPDQVEPAGRAAHSVVATGDLHQVYVV